MYLVANLSLSLRVKKNLKSANISQSYEQISSGTFLWLTVYGCVQIRGGYLFATTGSRKRDI